MTTEARPIIRTCGCTDTGKGYVELKEPPHRGYPVIKRYCLRCAARLYEAGDHSLQAAATIWYERRT